MNNTTDPTLPKPEHPDEAQIRAYGALSFLYLRSDMHKNIPLHRARLALQPPIDLRQYRVQYIDGVPRYAITWAHLSPEAEARLIAGETLKPADWNSGPLLWVIEIIAPYGQGTAAEAVRWLKRNLPERVDKVRYMRLGGPTSARRLFEVRRIKDSQWGTRLYRPQ